MSRSNYSAEKFDKDGETLWIVRIQDVRGVERVLNEESDEEGIPDFDLYPGQL